MADTDPPAPYPQRNATGHEVVVPAVPATVGPDEVVQWPYHLAGFEPVQAPPEPEPDLVPPVKSRRSADAAEEKGAGK
ncbi:hypothetical protein [Peterkaempfera griseoplana]|uniref:hypothetical protein n=1 Tax=Peterkaempfera griseoplana TaxID=66896 RepID=UPI0006E31513|nr:hypothetical protein [Peterkaempfera griseoplana]